MIDDDEEHEAGDVGTAIEAPAATALDRRGLFRFGATIAIGAALPACSKREEPRPVPSSPKPSAPAGAPPAQVGPPADVVELSFAELQARMVAGKETAKSLVGKYRQRIEALDQKGPKLRAVLELNPEADAIATQLDAERAAGKLRGPLHGLPILVKDNVETGDKMTTTAGSLVLEDSRADKDAFVVARLRAAGAIILGKANLSEWANFRGTASSSGWSARGGQCRNPVCARSLAIRLEQRLGGSRPRRACVRRRSAARPTDRSSRRRAATPWSGSSRRSAWSAAPA